MTFDRAGGFIAGCTCINNQKHVMLGTTGIRRHVKLYIHSPLQISESWKVQSSIWSLETRYGQSQRLACSGPWLGSRRGKEDTVWYGQEKKLLWVNIAVSLSLSYTYSYPYDRNKEWYVFIKMCHAYYFIFIMVHHSSLWFIQQ